ncbi:MAG: SLC13 family permease [Candidatus Izemoplasmatales bacterium]
MIKLILFFKKDIVFSIAMIFAIFSCFLVPPSRSYLGYINTTVIIIMFSLMIAVAGMKKANLFSKIAIFLTSKFFTIRYIAMTLVLSSFFLGMWVTNDAVLLTLVPFTIIVTKQTSQEKNTLLIVILQTFAANMGATLTPMGDPQNIYLYSYYHLQFSDFIMHMIPITLSALVLLILSVVLLIPNEFVHPMMVSPKLDYRKLPFYFLIFFLTLLTVLGVVPAYTSLINTLVLTIVFFPKLFKEVDYHLLLTFVMFFIFTGNMTSSGIFDHFFSSFLNSKISVYFVSFITSQFISNVPASILLSPFVTPEFAYSLVQGANVGAMGSIVGSLASLITFKFVIQSYPGEKKSYLKTYTFLSVIYIIIISCIVFLTYY